MRAARTRVAAGFAIACAVLASPAGAQQYPVRPIRLVIPYPAGASSNDIIGRALAQRLGDALGQQVVVDNRPGAGGNVGSEMVAKSAPDGYTLLVATNGPQAIGPSVYAKLGYDVLRDLAPVAMVANVPYVISINPAVPAKTVAEFIALAKAKPGAMHFASSGTGGTPHLCGEMLKSMAGIDIVHVPYKGGAPAVIDTIGGQTQMFCSGLTAVLQHVKTGKLRAIGAATLARPALMPELPTVAESGLPGFDVGSWLGIMGPARMPPAVVKRLHDEIARLVAAPEMRSFILTQGSEPMVMDPAKFGAYLRDEIAKWGRIVKAAGVRSE